jgi:ISXO2-like transposase domain
MHERNGKSLAFVVKNQNDAVPFVRDHVGNVSTIYADAGTGWDALHAGWDTKRVNHSVAFKDDGVCTNQAESYFSRLRRAEIGTHHHIADRHLGAFAREMVWREDHRRVNNHAQAAMVASAAMAARVSRDWAGYWQRAAQLTQKHCSMATNQLLTSFNFGSTCVAVFQMFPTQEPKRHLHKFPNLYGPSPLNNTETVKLSIAESTIDKLVQARRRSALFEAWAHLVGEMPPVNNSELVRRTEHSEAFIATLSDAKSCFKGVKRPYGEDDDGSCVYVYVIPTEYTVRWQSDMRTVAGVFPVPVGTVFTVHVSQSLTLQGENDGIWGMITKWEFINADGEQNQLPDGYGERYDELLWHR